MRVVNNFFYLSVLLNAAQATPADAAAAAAAATAATLATNLTSNLALDSSASTEKLDSLVLALQDFNAHHHVPSYVQGNKFGSNFAHLTRRSDFPILDTILTYLNDSGLAIMVIDFVLLRPEFLEIAINTTIWIIRLRLISLTDLLNALETSGLALDTLALGLEDPDILPGLINITREVISQSDLNFNLFNKREDYQSSFAESSIESKNGAPAFAPASAPAASAPAASAPASAISLSKRESVLLDQLFISLRESGLAIAVITHLLTSPELVEANAHFLVSILQSHAFNLMDLISSLKQANFIWDLIKQLLGNPQILREFGGIIKDRVVRGLIPKKLLGDK
ncbi:hypothetical protein KGF56_001020 [Candida oxycetoniae]|uniref:Uncharacterized protein n=1 Tax=Candida oxycetoniae TaxID=497107 RepID=A0AAI9SZN8_9ASCO|nr:uncharacterized protein KGF56_001020 [Candida oxycetoniae]KAI3406178.2 hypothetical protein KGF56_001020 [Candida oxycetoniae]